MITWKDITLFQFQQVEAINRKQISDIDRLLFTTCVVFKKTEYQLDNTPAKKVNRMINKVKVLFEGEFKKTSVKRIGKYFIDYNPENLTLGQYVELCYFFQRDFIQHANYILASITHSIFTKNNSGEHKSKSEYFLHQPICKISGSIEAFSKNFIAFNNEYSKLFESNNEMENEALTSSFMKNYGWMYSATQVAEYERITLDDAFKLSIRQALSDLTYLKEKANFDELQLKMNRNGR